MFADLRLVRIDDMGQPKPSLPRHWQAAIREWEHWLKVSGLAETSIRLRTDHIRTIARRSQTRAPRELTLQVIVTQCNRPWSNEHRKSVRASLVQFCGWAVMHGLMDDNPALHLPRVMPPTARARPAPDEVWRDVLANAPPREMLMARLAGEAGLRRGEICKVHYDDLVRDIHGWSLLVVGKGDKQRVVPLTESLAGAIIGFCPGGFVFPGPTGGHISAQYVGILVSKLMPPGWTCHKLRHRFASRAYSRTGNLRAVQEALGHASVATTQRYTAVSSREVRCVVEAAGDGPDVA